MRILAIDPGPVKSSGCFLVDDKPNHFFTMENERFLGIKYDFLDVIVIEKVACYGMAVGESIFETCVWTGRFMQEFGKWLTGYSYSTVPIIRMTRADVKLHLCGTKRAKDANVIQALKDRFGEKGTKKKPGVLYGIKKDEWQALAIAVTYAEKICK
jgi:hypothetical protein